MWACGPSPWQMKVGGSETQLSVTTQQVRGQPGLHECPGYSFFVNLTQTRVIWEGTSIEKIPLPDLASGQACGAFSLLMIDVEEPSSLWVDRFGL